MSGEAAFAKRSELCERRSRIREAKPERRSERSALMFKKTTVSVPLTGNGFLSE